MDLERAQALDEAQKLRREIRHHEFLILCTGCAGDYRRRI